MDPLTTARGALVGVLRGRLLRQGLEALRRHRQRADFELEVMRFVHDLALELERFGRSGMDNVGLWEAINRYATACGGDTGNATISGKRMDAVVAVEREIEALVAARFEERGTRPSAEVAAELDHGADAIDWLLEEVADPAAATRARALNAPTAAKLRELARMFREPVTVPEVPDGSSTQPEGAYEKFRVRRADLRDLPGGDRVGAVYYVLDVTHCEAARGAVLVYADALEELHGDRYAGFVRDVRGAPWVPSGVCRVCGCTDFDCRRCIEKTGIPCHWVDPEERLCSTCADEHAAAVAAEAPPATIGEGDAP